MVGKIVGPGLAQPSSLGIPYQSLLQQASLLEFLTKPSRASLFLRSSYQSLLQSGSVLEFLAKAFLQPSSLLEFLSKAFGPMVGTMDKPGLAQPSSLLEFLTKAFSSQPLS